MKLIKIIIFCFLLISIGCFSQEESARGTIKVGKSNCTLVKGNDSVYAVVDKMPEFPGGNEKMAKWMNENMKRGPVEGDQMTGTVFCSFVVQSDGSITDIVILKSITPALDKEAFRLISAMPKWKPGICHKREVPVKVNYPIKFGLR
ncbi:MAG: TonB family protein [Bacteroidia bacterium]